LLGQPHNLVTWRINQIVERVTDFKELQAQVAALAQTNDEASFKRWLKEGEGRKTSERNTAAERGTAVHQAIELDLKPNECTDEVRPFIIQYHAMKADVGFTILAQERQVWNLTAGYAGTLDAIVKMPDERFLVVDWKTSKDVYVDYVMQAHAYLAAEFVGNDGEIDHVATALLHNAKRGAIAKLSEIGWSWHEFEFDPVILRAWMGSLAFARYTYENEKPVFDLELKGHA
jgi:hypothetical protein